MQSFGPIILMILKVNTPLPVLDEVVTGSQTPGECLITGLREIRSIGIHMAHIAANLLSPVRLDQLEPYNADSPMSSGTQREVERANSMTLPPFWRFVPQLSFRRHVICPVVSQRVRRNAAGRRLHNIGGNCRDRYW